MTTPSHKPNPATGRSATQRRFRARGLTASVVAIVMIVGAACGGSSSTTDQTDRARQGASTTAPSSSTPTTAGREPILIVITDDDGIGAPGIDKLARELSKLPAVTIEVVAPATDQSGKGDSTTPGKVAYHDATTASGIAGIAVEGTPADSVHVALEVLKLKPDLVASGINKGQNVGPIAAVSGTVGAALTAARLGVPAIAGSAGITDPDYAPAAQLVVEWIVANRARIAAGTASTESVVNINIPGCTSGTIHGLVEVPTAKAIPQGVNPFATDCAAMPADAKPTDDVDALIKGFAAKSLVPTH